MLRTASGKLVAALALLALVVAVGGGAGYAGAKIGTNDIENNAITSPKVKKDTLTGKDIKESKLERVPRASEARDADYVNNVQISEIRYRKDGGSAPAAIFSVDGFSVRAGCDGASNVSLTATTVFDDGFISTVVHGDTSPAAANPAEADLEDDDFDAGDTLDLLAGGSGNVNIVLFNYLSVSTTTVTGQLAIDEIGDECQVTGFITSQDG